MDLLNGEFYIWGTGVRANQLNQTYCNELEQINICGYIDNNSKKWGSYFKDKKIFSPDVLKKENKKYIIIANQYKKEIIEQIEKDYANYQWEIVEENIFTQIQIIKRYDNNTDSEIREVIERLKKNPLKVFNYNFIEKYDLNSIEVYFDKEKGLFYAIYFGKKMYFARAYNTVEKAKTYYRSILLEQDTSSPHLYLTRKFCVKNNDIVVDAGAAEGNFTLSIIDKVKKVYIFEPDLQWIEALQYTFEPYINKVIIINKFISNYKGYNTTTIDNELQNIQIDFIKMDIEGEEYYALQGAKYTIEHSNKIKCAICTYHQVFAYIAIEQLLSTYGFNVENSYGYMWYPCGSMNNSVLRRGIIRGIKR